MTMPTQVASRSLGDDVELLHQLNRDYVSSVAASDVSWFENNLADDFINISADGVLMDRAAFLAQIAKPFPMSNLAATEVLLRIFGDVAVVNARSSFTKPDGQTGSRRYTDVWSRQRGRWLCVSAQLTHC
jgi:ketosteroid isomerase-like protein